MASNIKPDMIPALNNLARLLASNSIPALKDASEAIRLAEKACAITNYQDSFLLNTLSITYASDNRFQKASESLDVFTQKLAYSKGTVNKLLEDESLYNNVNDVSAKVNTILEKIDNGQGLMGSLISDDELTVELKTTLKELNVLIKDIEANPHRYFKFSIF